MTTTRNHHALDPRILGRPVHLIGNIAALLREDLSEALHARLNRRYRAQFALGPASLAPAAHERTPRRQLAYDTPVGRIGFCLDRELLLCILGYRYGAYATDDAASEAHADEPETATEERLAATLGLQLVSVVVDRILKHIDEQPAAERDAKSGGSAPAVSHVGFANAPRDAWVLHAPLSEPSRRASGALQFWIEHACIARLLHCLGPAPGVRKTPPLRAARPLPARLQLKLTARLLEIETPLGRVLDLRVGDVVPVSFGAADVLIDDSRLFRASVAEHRGKLCLTCFQDVE